MLSFQHDSSVSPTIVLTLSLTVTLTENENDNIFDLDLNEWWTLPKQISILILIFEFGYVCVCVCVFVCVFVTPNKEKYWADLKKNFFSCKGMDRQSNMGHIRSFAHNAELQQTPKTVKKSSKNRVFRTSTTVLQKVLARFRRKLAQWCKRYIRS